MDAAHSNKHLLSDYVYGIPLLLGIILQALQEIALIEEVLALS